MKNINSMYVRANYRELDATKVPSAIDIAWAAGVYEGEGSVRLCGRKKRGLAGSLAQKDPEILFRLRDWFGGSVCAPGQSYPCHYWNFCGDRCRIFLALIYPFLSVRRKLQVDETGALDYLRGASPEGLSIESLKSLLLKMYEEHRAKTWRVNHAAIRKQRYASDPEYRERCKVSSAKHREKRQLTGKIVSIA